MERNPKRPNAIDVGVGCRIRLQRKMRGMSQQALAEALGITFQQVQKYEKGSNRVGASRLSQIAVALGVPVSFFFERDGSGTEAAGGNGETGSTGPVMTFLSTGEGLELNRAFAGIRSEKVRRRVVAMVKAIGATAEEDA